MASTVARISAYTSAAGRGEDVGSGASVGGAVVPVPVDGAVEATSVPQPASAMAAIQAQASARRRFTGIERIGPRC